MTASGSMAARAALAVVLMIGFYLLATVLVCVLLYLPYAEWVYAHRLHVKLAIGCVAGRRPFSGRCCPARSIRKAGSATYGGRAPVPVPGIEAVARVTGQAMPAEVYLVPDLNAWVGQRGGLMVSGAGA